MKRRGVVARAILALIAVGPVLGIGLVGLSDAEATPGPCGFVNVQKDGTTTMVTLGEYCPPNHCTDEGPNHYQPPMGAGGVTVEAWVCVGMP